MKQPSNKYPYFNLSQAAKPGGDEWKCRNRRTQLFGNTTGLIAVTVQKKCCLAEIDRIRRHMHLDHLSAWVNKSGTLFILNEPYGYNKAEISGLEQAGYEVRIVPINLAPYCGRFDPAKGAQPWTTSLLITQHKNADELESIYQELKKAVMKAPEWNT